MRRGRLCRDEHAGTFSTVAGFSVKDEKNEKDKTKKTKTKWKMKNEKDEKNVEFPPDLPDLTI